MKVNRACPSDDVLVRSTSGELRSHQLTHVLAHLRTCEACRRRVETLDAALDVYRAPLNHAPPTPAEWSGFHEALVTEENAWRGRKRLYRRRWSSSVIAFAATLLAAVVWYTQTEVTLDAEGVITRAVEYERHQPAKPRTAVAIRAVGKSGPSGHRAGPHDLAATIVARQETVSQESAAGRELARRLAPYGFDWSTPFSTVYFQRWRQTVDVQHERVERPSSLLLKVAVEADDSLSEAEIIVRTETFELVTQTWRFADGFAVELNAVSEDAPAAVSPPGSSTARSSVKELTPSPAAIAALSLETVELDARIALQRMGTPIGRGMFLRRLGDRIRIEGSTDAPSKVKQIVAYARKTEHLDARVEVRAAGGTSGEAGWSPALDRWFDQKTADPELRASFLRTTRDSWDRMEDGIAAFSELAHRYPVEVHDRLSSHQQVKVEALASAEYHALVSAYEALERQLALLIGTISRPMLGETLSPDWRVRAAQMSKLREEFHSRLNHVFFNPAMQDPQELANSARLTIRPALADLAAAIAGTPGAAP